MNREREYRITFNKTKSWTCKYTFAELVEILLLPKHQKLPLNADCYLIASANDLVSSHGDPMPGKKLLSRTDLTFVLLKRVLLTSIACTYVCIVLWVRFDTQLLVFTFTVCAYVCMYVCTVCASTYVCSTVSLCLSMFPKYLCMYVCTHVKWLVCNC